MSQVPQQDKKKITLARVKRTEAYAEQVRVQFATTVNEILALYKTMPELDEGEMYSFDGENLKKQKEVERLLRQLHAAATVAIERGIKLEWAAANADCDKLFTSCFGKAVLSTPQFTADAARNNAAMQAFLARSDRGLNLSQRVWKSVEQLRDEMEVSMTVAIGEGESASSMSRKVRKYLNDPDLCFRRFRYKAGEEKIFDDEGNEIGTKPIYGKKWKKRVRKADGSVGWIDYDKDSYKDEWTGRGYYKSSAQNAMRVARTETNIAYRRADNERWQQLDFVLGQRIELSKQHPKKDICDKLAGDYPKDFIFDGWHPQCFCFVTPILMDESEMKKATEAFARGETYTPRGKVIRDYPEGFKSWVRDNAENIAAARERGTEPYFIRNNAQKIDEIIDPSKKQLTALERAAIRHENRTPEQEEAIKLRWQEREQRLAEEKAAQEAAALAEQKRIERINSTANRVLSVVSGERFAGLDIDTSLLEAAINSGDTDIINTETRALAQLLSKKQQLINKTASNVTKVAAEYNEVDASALQAALASKSLAEIQTQTKLLAQQILKAKQAKVNSLSATAITVEKIDVNVVPEMQYTSTASKKMTWGDKADNAIRAAIYYDGEKGIAAALYKKYIGNITDTSRAKSIIKQVDSYIGEASVVEYPAIEHLMILRNTKDLSVINPLWRSRYNELIKELNKYDYSQGIKSIISKIEEAHNILKLSTTKKAVDFGLNKLSHRTPYQIFDEFEAKIPGFSASCPSKEFFDMFTEYVPLFTKGKGAYFSGMKKHVLIALNDSDNVERLTDSVWYRRGLFTHEFGHANDILTGQRNDAKLKKIFDDWKSEIAKDKGASLEKAIVDALQPYRDSFKDWWENSTIKQQADAEVSAAKTYDAKKKAIDKRAKLYSKEYSKQLCDIEEQIGCLSDCLGAALGGARFVTPRGHTGTYFLSKDKQYGEFIAHCSENYWSGNAHFKSLAPQLYEAMRKYIESKLPKK